MKKSELKKLLREEITRTLKGGKVNEARIDEMAKIEGGLKNAIEKIITDNPELEGLALKKAIKTDAAVKAILANTGEDLYDNQLNKFISLIKGERELQQRGRKPGSGEAKPKENGAGIGTDTVNSIADMVKYVTKAKKEGKTLIGSKTNPDGTITIKYKKEEVDEVVEPLDEMAKISGALKADIERVINDNPDLTGLALKKAIKNDSYVKDYLDNNPDVELYDNQLNRFISLVKGERENQPKGRKPGSGLNVEGAKTMEFSSLDEFLKFLKIAEKKGYEILASKIDGEDVKVKYRKSAPAETLNESKEEQLVRKLIREELTSIMDEESNKIPQEIEDYISSLFDMSITDEEEDGDPFDEIFSKEEFGDDNGEFDETVKYIKNHGGSITVKGNPNINASVTKDGSIQLTGIHSLTESTEELDEMAKIAGDLKSAIEKIIKDNPDLDNLPLKKKIKSNPEVTAALGGETLHDNQLNKFISLTKGERVVGPRGRKEGGTNAPKTEPKEKSTEPVKRGAGSHRGKDKQYSFVQGAKSYTVNKTASTGDENDPLKGIAEPTDLELRKMARSGVEGEKEATLKAQQKRKMVNAFVQRMRDAGILDTANRPIDREAYDQAWAEEKEKINAKLATLKEEAPEQLSEGKLKMQFLAGIISEQQYREGKQLL